MKLKWIGSLLILAGVVGCKIIDRPNLVEYVNPNIGTVYIVVGSFTHRLPSPSV